MFIFLLERNQVLIINATALAGSCSWVVKCEVGSQDESEQTLFTHNNWFPRPYNKRKRPSAMTTITSNVVFTQKWCDFYPSKKSFNEVWNEIQQTSFRISLCRKKMFNSGCTWVPRHLNVYLNKWGYNRLNRNMFSHLSLGAFIKRQRILALMLIFECLRLTWFRIAGDKKTGKLACRGGIRH